VLSGVLRGQMFRWTTRKLCKGLPKFSCTARIHERCDAGAGLRVTQCGARRFHSQPAASQELSCKVQSRELLGQGWVHAIVLPVGYNITVGTKSLRGAESLQPKTYELCASLFALPAGRPLNLGCASRPTRHRIPSNTSCVFLLTKTQHGKPCRSSFRICLS